MRSNQAGVSVVARIGQIVSAVADHEPLGARLLDVAEATGIARPTVHRILGELVATGLVEPRGGRRYGLGAEVSKLGLIAPPPFVGVEHIRVIVEQLAERSTVTAYVGALVHRRVHYLARGQGSSPVHVYAVAVGDTAPLPATHAGIALLSTMPAGTRDEIIAHVRTERALRSSSAPLVLDEARIRTAVRDIEDRGYFRMRDLTLEGVCGMAAAVPSAPGRPRMAVSLAAVGGQLLSEKSDHHVTMLIEAAQAIGEAEQAAARAERY